MAGPAVSLEEMGEGMGQNQSFPETVRTMLLPGAPQAVAVVPSRMSWVVLQRCAHSQWDEVALCEGTAVLFLEPDVPSPHCPPPTCHGTLAERTQGCCPWTHLEGRSLQHLDINKNNSEAQFSLIIYRHDEYPPCISCQ